jgi:hypothetical protein
MIKMGRLLLAVSIIFLSTFIVGASTFIDTAHADCVNGRC